MNLMGRRMKTGERRRNDTLGLEKEAFSYWLSAFGWALGWTKVGGLVRTVDEFTPAGLSPPRCTSLATFPMVSPDRRQCLVPEQYRPPAPITFRRSMEVS